MSTAFSVHGAKEITVENNIITIRSVGPWNIEYFHLLHQDLIAAVTLVDFNNYAVLLVPLGEAISVAEALDYHVAFLKKGNTKAVAINLAGSDVPNSTKSLCTKAYEQAGLNFKFFTSDEEAKQWLQDILC
ncbi:hypothetical protein GCM10009111_00970 [Colwellia asteriadis]|uniref:STAS/SEC14 domain-containing protein n=1 Tax=Colwellia asteriadis TaxID=517723 RepID=A0ABN1L268_9GAMM